MWADRTSLRGCQELVRRGADVHAGSKTGFTPLMFAAQQDDVESARILIQRRRKPKMKSGRNRGIAPHALDYRQRHG